MIVDVVRKIQFLVEVYVPKGLSLWEENQQWIELHIPDTGASSLESLHYHETTALPFPAGPLFFLGRDQERLMLFVLSPPCKNQG